MLEKYACRFVVIDNSFIFFPFINWFRKQKKQEVLKSKKERNKIKLFNKIETGTKHKKKLKLEDSKVKK